MPRRPSKPRSKAKHRTKPGRARVAKASAASLRPADARRVDVAVARLDAAQKELSRRAADLSAVLGGIAENAVVKRDEQLVRQLVDRELLRDLLDLREAIAVAATGSLPAPLERLCALPEAMLQWFADAFGIEPDGEPGLIRELPVRSLSKFECDFDAPADGDGLIRVCVQTPGWRRNGKQVAPARLSLVPRQHVVPTSSGEATEEEDA